MKATPMMKPGRYTPDQVLAWLSDRVAEEPGRLNMRKWVWWFKGLRKHPDCNLQVDDLPACQTVACAAGWILIGTRRFTAKSSVYAIEERAGGWFGSAALKALGLKEDEGAGQRLAAMFPDTYLSPARVVQTIARIREEFKDELTAKRSVIVKGATKKVRKR